MLRLITLPRRVYLWQSEFNLSQHSPELYILNPNSLPEAKSDTALEVGVTKTFSAFGPVFVKIRRDHKNMPFAFCQYTVRLT